MGRVATLAASFTATTAVILVTAACGIGAVGTEPVEGGARPVGEAGPGFVSEAGAPDAPIVPANASLSYTVGPAPASVDLTAEGTLDWAHWGYRSLAGPVRKAGGGSVVSDFTTSGTNVVAGNYGSPAWPLRVSWTNGDASGATEPGTQSFRYMANASDGVAELAAATGGAAMRRLVLYVGGYASKATLELSLSDGSAGGVSDASQGNTGALWVSRYVIDYRAATPGATLLVKWRVTNLAVPTSSIGIDSATLQ